MFVGMNVLILKIIVKALLLLCVCKLLVYSFMQYVQAKKITFGSLHLNHNGFVPP
jgi:hypothetical protein